jgi:hypothetical protein
VDRRAVGLVEPRDGVEQRALRRELRRDVDGRGQPLGHGGAALALDAARLLAADARGGVPHDRPEPRLQSASGLRRMLQRGEPRALHHVVGARRVADERARQAAREPGVLEQRLDRRDLGHVHLVAISSREEQPFIGSGAPPLWKPRGSLMVGPAGAALFVARTAESSKLRRAWTFVESPGRSPRSSSRPRHRRPRRTRGA